ncbi:MAG: betaine--homocysteine S-methyltransferase [Rhodoferax sp.]|jgi:5-methyltetrahydrofolate--homocysteine methyltransferase|nr:betaine--homocysteine S-methyltransferase [Rhodoferax sp.]
MTTLVSVPSQDASTNRFTHLLATRPWLLADGATGSNLFDVGLMSGDAPELWNTEHPDRIAKLHQDFVDAGADIILTNSFGGTVYRLKLHNAQGRMAELNTCAAQIARKVADASGRTVAVAGSMGPTGEIMEPIGPLTFEQAKAAFAEQALALAAGGADVLWIETMSSREEVEAAVAGAAVAKLPIVCTLSFDTNGRTMMGISPSDFSGIEKTLSPRLAACGTNCGVGASEVVACIHNLAEAMGPDVVLVAKGNCGIPQYVDGAICYNGTPEIMANYARMALDAGARIIGGCCGTSARHLRAMREALDAHAKGASPSLEAIVSTLGDVSTGARAQWGGEQSRLGGAAPGANLARGRGGRSRRGASDGAGDTSTEAVG